VSSLSSSKGFACRVLTSLRTVSITEAGALATALEKRWIRGLALANSGPNGLRPHTIRGSESPALRCMSAVATAPAAVLEYFFGPSAIPTSRHTTSDNRQLAIGN